MLGTKGLAVCVLLHVHLLLTGTSEAASVEWGALKQSAKSLAVNAAVLTVQGQAPLQHIRQGMDDLKQCFAETYEEEAYACLSGPAERAAAAYLVLTDFRTWIRWPWVSSVEEEIVDNDDFILEVLKRRMWVKVRSDQCDKEKRPSK